MGLLGELRVTGARHREEERKKGSGVAAALALAPTPSGALGRSGEPAPGGWRRREDGALAGATCGRRDARVGAAAGTARAGGGAARLAALAALRCATTPVPLRAWAVAAGA